MSDTANTEKKANPAKSFLTGGFGGICTVISGHPLDTIKVRLQTMPRPAPGEQPLYKGTFDCAAKTIKNEGVLGLYKGMSAPIVGVAPIFALCFAGYALGKRIQQTDGNAKLTYPQIFVAGSFSGLLSTVVTAPGERIKCLLQIQQASSAAERKYHGMLDCAAKLFKEGGIRSLYKGSCATLLRDLPANGVYFLAYESIQDLSKKKSGSDKVSLSVTLLAGGSAGIAYWLVGMPADVLKSRLQTDLPANGTYFVSYELTQNLLTKDKPKGSGFWESVFAGGIAGMSYWILGMPADVLKSRLQTAPEGTYKRGVRDVFIELMKTDGPTALYRGVQPVMIRAFPANAACFFGIELANWFFSIVAPDF